MSTAGATTDELDAVVARMVAARSVRADHAERILSELRPRVPPHPWVEEGARYLVG